MESQQQDVQLQMELLNHEPHVPPQSSSCVSRTMVVVSVLCLVSAICTCLLFFFVFRPACVQEPQSATALTAPTATTPPAPPTPPTEPTAGTVHFSIRLREIQQNERNQIFQAEKNGNYMIHGWLERNFMDSEIVKLVHICKGKLTLQKKIETGFICTSTQTLPSTTMSAGSFCSLNPNAYLGTPMATSMSMNYDQAEGLRWKQTGRFILD
ncbi:hypothetical protein WMY93_024524 [Mugilogobius chulae]|uniref:TNF family profile domain-containing protein n=1 Tax=Mugilogobius chulae TaxID=88201 RepID=A0AAW0N5F4_9GOBI